MKGTLQLTQARGSQPPFPARGPSANPSTALRPVIMDAFNVLQRGLRFDKKRFAEEMAAFRPQASGDSAMEASSSALDFFGDEERVKPQPPKRGKRRGDSQGDSQEEDGSAGVSNPKKKKTRGGKKGAVAAAPLQTMSAEEIQILRKQHRITLKGADIPPPLRCFTDLKGCAVSEPLLTALVEAHAVPTPVQMQAMPVMIADRDTLAVAPTGSGKTLAFVVPLLMNLKSPQAKGFRGCIIAPTRELAVQIEREVQKVNRGYLNVRLLDRTTAFKNSFGKGSSQRFDLLISTPLILVQALSKYESYHPLRAKPCHVHCAWIAFASYGHSHCLLLRRVHVCVLASCHPSASTERC